MRSAPDCVGEPGVDHGTATPRSATRCYSWGVKNKRKQHMAPTGAVAASPCTTGASHSHFFDFNIRAHAAGTGSALVVATSLR